MSTLGGQRLSPEPQAGWGGQRPDGGTRDHRGFHTATNTAPGNRLNCAHFLYRAEDGLTEDTREAGERNKQRPPFFF